MMDGYLSLWFVTTDLEEAQIYDTLNARIISNSNKISMSVAFVLFLLVIYFHLLYASFS